MLATCAIDTHRVKTGEAWVPQDKRLENYGAGLETSFHPSLYRLYQSLRPLVAVTPARPCAFTQTPETRAGHAYIPKRYNCARDCRFARSARNSSVTHTSLGPRPIFGEEKRPGAICSRMREKLRKITVKSLVYVEMKYTAEVFGTRLLLHVFTSVHG